MTLKLFKTIFLFIIVSAYPQQTSLEKLNIMRNYIILGLEEKAFDIGAQLISYAEHKSVREEALFYLGEYHFIKAILLTDDKKILNDASTAFTYYTMLNRDYPNGKFFEDVNNRLLKLESDSRQSILLQDFFEGFLTEAKIVNNYINLTTQLYKTRLPNVYAFLLGGEKNNSIANLERFYDDIIVNYPRFEIYGYYWKFVSNLSAISGFEFLSSGFLEFNSPKIHLNSEGKYLYAVTKAKLDSWLKDLVKKYPNHTITLDLHLLMANVSISLNQGTPSKDTQEYVEYVVQNETDKTNIRYLLAKEFLLNNKFK